MFNIKFANVHALLYLTASISFRVINTNQHTARKITGNVFLHVPKEVDTGDVKKVYLTINITSMLRNKSICKTKGTKHDPFQS